MLTDQKNTKSRDKRNLEEVDDKTLGKKSKTSGSY